MKGIQRHIFKLLVISLFLGSFFPGMPLWQSMLAASTFTSPTLHPLAGIPGGKASLTGSGFLHFEEVEIWGYWGSSIGTFEGISVIDGKGHLSFTFSAPSHLSVGTYVLTVKRYSGSPKTASTTFRVLAPVVEIEFYQTHNGIQLFLAVSNFGSSELVTLTSATSGTYVIKVYMNGHRSYGHPGSYYSPGFFSYGFLPRKTLISEFFTATGQTSGLQTVSNHVYYNYPGISLSPDNGIPGSTIIVNGGGYLPGTLIAVHFGGHPSVTGQADTEGNVQIPLQVPYTNNPKDTYHVYTGDVTVSAQFFFTPLRLWTESTTVSYGSAISLHGQGYAAGEVVDLFWNNGQTGHELVGTVVTKNDGTFTTTLNAPSAPASGKVQISARGMLTHAEATTTINETANVVLTPTSGPVGTLIQVQGGGFHALVQVTLFFQGTIVRTVVTDHSGGFITHFIIPITATIGTNLVLVTEGTSGIQATAPFEVTP